MPPTDGGQGQEGPRRDCRGRAPLPPRPARPGRRPGRGPRAGDRGPADPRRPPTIARSAAPRLARAAAPRTAVRARAQQDVDKALREAEEAARAGTPDPSLEVKSTPLEESFDELPASCAR